jgi:PAS domain S-box-containing protein
VLETDALERLPEPRLLELILDNVAEGIFTVDRHFRVRFFNPAAERITGYRAAEVQGRYCHEVFRASACDRECPLRQSMRSGSTVQDYELEIRTRAGKTRTISVCTAPLLEADGSFQGGVETFRDLTAVQELRKEITGRYTFQDIISKNSKMLQIFKTLPNIAQSDATVLLQGRSGTGKELFAAAIHNLSPRVAGPLVTVNCGALPETLLESELFGYVKGAFTDAKQNRRGRFLAAEGGTILLDEIGDMPASMQVKLLRVLERREVQPLGSERTEHFDVRVVASTNQDLEQLVGEGRFREDLYFRLNVILIQLPDLVERVEDIPLLVEHFVERFNRRMSRNIRGMTEQAMAALMRYGFPGNVRELENMIEHAIIISTGPKLRLEDLPPHLTSGSRWPASGLRARFRAPGAVPPQPASERQQIVEVLVRNFWSLPRAARELGMHRTTLWRKVRRLGIERP